MKKKFISFDTWFLVGTIAIVTSGVIAVSITMNQNKTNNSKVNANWNNIPIGLKEFSENNSFKISLQSSNFISGSGGSSYMVSSGTAWSYYYKQISSNFYDWYLITNFHVVNEPLAYINNLSYYDSNSGEIKIIDEKKLEKIYNQQYVTSVFNSNPNYMISIEKYINSSYVPILDTHYDGSNIVGKSDISRLEIITDFDNDNINLFSENNNYNLDMALIKLTINTQKINVSSSTANPINVYTNSDELDIDNNLETYIAGNPGDKESLIPILDKIKWVRNDNSLNTDGILSNLEAPYYYSVDSYNNFPLTAGASGSAMYQFDKNQLLDDYDANYKFMNNLIPVGIYWGGISRNSSFRPSVIPFFVPNMYNVYDNFLRCINNGQI